MLEPLREQLYHLHLELPRQHLVAWTSGNISARDRDSGLVVIKPSGVRYEALRPEHMVVVDLDGRVIAGLYRSRISTGAILLMIAAAVVAAVAALLVSDAGDAVLAWLVQSWNALVGLVRGWFG